MARQAWQQERRRRRPRAGGWRAATWILLAVIMLSAGFQAPAQAQAPAGSTAVYGTDDRIPVSNQATDPLAPLGYVESLVGDQIGVSTAFLIGACHALTTQHGVIGPAREEVPLVFVTGAGQRIPAIIDMRGQGTGRLDDWALLRLRDCVGSSLGTFSLDAGDPGRLILAGTRLLLPGFPFDAPPGAAVADPDCRTHGYYGDGALAIDCTAGSGMSGGPLLRQRGRGMVVVGLNLGTTAYAIGRRMMIDHFNPVLLGHATPIRALLSVLARRVPDLRVVGVDDPPVTGTPPSELQIERYNTLVLELAEAGDPFAQLFLCLNLFDSETGELIRDNPYCDGMAADLEAIEGVEQVPLLAYQLAQIYAYGLGTQVDGRRAAELLLLGVADGMPESQYLMARLIEEGVIETNLIDPLALYGQAARQFHAPALMRLGELAEGRGQQLAALRLYRMAAQSGSAQAAAAAERLAQSQRGQ